MKKLDGTVTLSILDEDNSQRVIFRIIPLCTKEGIIFQNRKSSYPDFGSLRVIPDKREQSSFKDRMREMGTLCCVQLINDGKELTKIRQNRNYDPNQDEHNQYAIYSDVICGFEQDAVFEVFQENDDITQALTETVLLQRGKVLYGPVAREEEVRWDALKPFGNENYLMHTVEDTDGNNRTYYWNPEAIVTWRQRKKDLKRGGVHRREENLAETELPVQLPVKEHAPAATKLELPEETTVAEEPKPEADPAPPVDVFALEFSETAEYPLASPRFFGTPMADTPKYAHPDKQNNGFVHGVVEKQIKAQQSMLGNAKPAIRPLENPIENLRDALESVLSIPSLHKDFVRLIGENDALMQAVYENKLIDGHTKYASYSAAKAEFDDIEGKRIAILLELDKAKANYQQLKDDMFAELAKQKKTELEKLDQRIQELHTQKKTIEQTLAELGEDLRSGTVELLKKQEAMDIQSNGSDIILSPTVGSEIEPDALVESVRCALSGMGFRCKQDCVIELMAMLSLHDEFCLVATSIPEAELYLQTALRALGLLNVTAWPSVFGTLRVASLLPENDLRTPTIEIIRNKRTPVKAYGHKVIRLIDTKHYEDAGTLPVFRAPELKTARGQENRNTLGVPVSLRTIHTFSDRVELMNTFGEEWFDAMEHKLHVQEIELPGDVTHAMRVFARATAPKVNGGFIEAADTAVLIWIVPAMLARKTPHEKIAWIIEGLPKCMHFAFQE